MPVMLFCIYRNNLDKIHVGCKWCVSIISGVIYRVQSRSSVQRHCYHTKFNISARNYQWELHVNIHRHDDNYKSVYSCDNIHIFIYAINSHKIVVTFLFSSDELPVQLTLPRAMREAKNHQQLSSLALLGQGKVSSCKLNVVFQIKNEYWGVLLYSLYVLWRSWC